MALSSLPEKVLFWKKHLEAQPQSGQSQIGYCKHHDISDNAFTYWKRRMGSAKRDFLQRGAGNTGILYPLHDAPSARNAGVSRRAAAAVLPAQARAAPYQPYRPNIRTHAWYSSEIIR